MTPVGFLGMFGSVVQLRLVVCAPVEVQHAERLRLGNWRGHSGCCAFVLLA